MKNSIHPSYRLTALGFLGMGLAFGPWAHFSALAVINARPQIVFAIGNSESMDGNLSGAIMTGSGSVPLNRSSLTRSSSPVSYSVPAGFTPPVQAADANGKAPYTVSNGNLFDNSPSRLNVAKQGLNNVLAQYLKSMDFGIVNYQTSGTNEYQTWVYYMSPPGGFVFTNIKLAGARYVENPCYTGAGSLSMEIANYCSSISSRYGDISNKQFMQIDTSSDDANVNDVLYAYPNFPGLFINYNGPYKGNTLLSTSNFYSYYTLNMYNGGTSNIQTTYLNTLPNIGQWSSYPTNAAYVPFSPEVMQAQRGFGYGGDQSPSTGLTKVAMTSLGLTPTASAVNAALAPFTAALAPETNNLNTTEIKASAGQAATAGLLVGAGNMLSGLTATCAGQFVILVTDGLPTMDKSGKPWPPLGSAPGKGYGVWAKFKGIGASDEYGLRDGAASSVAGPVGTFDSSNDDALTNTIDQIKALNTKGIKTYVIGLGAGVDASANPAAAAALNAMAIAGGTAQQFPANDIVSFNAALNKIATDIFDSIQVTAPVAPNQVSGTSLVYTATSSSVPGNIAGHVKAYPVSDGSTATWDAGDAAHMGTAARIANLYSTKATATGAPIGSGSVVKLSSMGKTGDPANDSAVFGLTPTTCIPDTDTIVAYTMNPSYKAQGDLNTIAGLGSTSTIPASCSYIGTRQLNWMLGSFSANNDTHFLAPPGSAALLTAKGYVTFGTNNKNRGSQLLFTNNDGFLYGVDALTGNLKWGWMPRPFISNLKNYGTFAEQNLFDGKFILADAVDVGTNATSANWGTYVVGTAGKGAYHYSLKIGGDSTELQPISQAWGISSGVGVTSPQMQAPIVVTIGSAQYAIFVTNPSATTGKSTLYEINVATGLSKAGDSVISKDLAFRANSTLSYDAATGTIWVGDDAGGVWNFNLTGDTNNDAASASKVAVTDPAEPVKFVGYSESGEVPYIFAASETKISVFALSGNASSAVWAAVGGNTPIGQTAGTSGILSTSASVAALQSKGTIAAQPVIANGVLIVPVEVPTSGPNTCGVSKGYYDLYDLVSGTSPKIKIKYNGVNYSSTIIPVGNGTPLTPTITTAEGGKVQVYPGSKDPDGGKDPNDPNSPDPTKAYDFGGGVMNKPISWRQM